MAQTVEPLPTAECQLVPSSIPQLSIAKLVTKSLITIDIGRILAVSGIMGSLKVGNVQLGQATIDQLVIRDITTSIHSGRAFFENVRTVIRVDVIVDWWCDILFSSGNGRETLTSPLIPLEVGNLLVPSLQNISFSVPQVAVEGAQAQLTPVIGLDLGGGRFDDVKVNATKLPSSGFSLSGLGIGALTLDAVGVPATVTESVSVAQFHPNGNLVLPGVDVTGIQVPAAQVPRVVSNSPVNIFSLQPQESYPIGGLDLGVFGFRIAVKPFIDLQIGVLTLDDVSLQAAFGSLQIEGVTSPVTVQDIALGDVRLQQVTVNQISV